MGDRANFGFRQGKDVIFLYGHNAGHEMLKNLASAVAQAEPRWTDDSYATRIVISQLVGDNWNSETGWGLTVNRVDDNEHSIPVLDWEDGTFSLYESGFTGGNGTPKFTMSIPAFVAKYSK